MVEINWIVIIVLFLSVQLLSCKKIYLYTRLLPLDSKPNDTTHLVDTSHYEVTENLPSPHLHTSNLTLIKLEACNNEDGDNKYSVKRNITCNQRETRSIIADDNRIELDREEKRRYPYTTMANITSRCNGVVIGYKYVLTAAQCVYHSHYSRPTVTVIRVNDGETNQIKAEIEKVFLPIEWVKKENTDGRFNYNYALVKLTQSQPTYVPIHMNTPTIKQSHCGAPYTQAGFDFKNKNGEFNIIKSTCRSKFETFETTFMDCDSNVNEKGNPLFTLYRRKDGHLYHSVGGILVGNYGQYYLENRIDGKEYNLGLRINYQMYLRLCAWMGKIDKCRRYYPDYFPLDSLTEI